MAGLPGSAESLMPPGEDWLVRKVQELERRVNELVAHDVLRAAGVETEKDLIRILGSLIVTGDLSVPNGSINNDALASPVTGATGTGSASSVTLTTTTGVYAPVTFTVPSGFTRAQVMGVSAMYAGGLVASILQCRIAGSDGPEMYAFTNAAYANAAASNARSLSGLTPGGTFAVSSVAKTSTGSTTAYLITSASVLFLR